MLICLARVYGMLALREGVCWVRGLCEDLLGVDLPSGASACQRKKRYLTTGTRAIEVIPSTYGLVRTARGQRCRVWPLPSKPADRCACGGYKRCQTARCHAGGTPLPMQLIREDVSKEVAFALGLKVRLGQRAGHRARRQEPGNAGQQFGCGCRARCVCSDCGGP